MTYPKALLGALSVLAIGTPARAQNPSPPPLHSRYPISLPVAPRAGQPFTKETAPASFAKSPSSNWKPSKRWAVGATLGTDGVGGDLQYGLTRSLVLRARAVWLKADHAETYDRIRYEGHASLSSYGAFVDIHPFGTWLGRPFMASLGAVSGRRRAAIRATPQGSFSLGGTTYTAAQLGSLTGEIVPARLAPFAGIGWDNTFTGDGPIGFRVLAGVVYSDKQDVTLRSTGGLLSGTSALNGDIQREEAAIRDGAKALRFYPAISTGLTYKF